MCFSRDSACDKNTIANIVARKKVSRATAFNRFMVLFLLLCASIRDFCFLRPNHQLTPCNSVGRRYCAGASKKGKQNFFGKDRGEYQLPPKKVTEQLPYRQIAQINGVRCSRGGDPAA